MCVFEQRVFIHIAKDTANNPRIPSRSLTALYVSVPIEVEIHSRWLAVGDKTFFLQLNTINPMAPLFPTVHETNNR